MKVLPQSDLRGMQPTLDAIRRIIHGASRLMQVISASSVKPRRAPSRHCRDARVYIVHATTAMHDDEYTSPTALVDRMEDVV